MCLAGYKRKYQISSGIECYKVLRRVGYTQLHSLCCHTNVNRKLGGYIEGYDIPWRWYDFIYRTKRSKKIAAARYIDKHKRFLTREVVHSFKSFDLARELIQNSNEVIVKCIIPEGEVYWENDDVYGSFSVKLLEIVYQDPIWPAFLG